jgi:hypothetical protein
MVLQEQQGPQGQLDLKDRKAGQDLMVLQVQQVQLVQQDLKDRKAE